MKQLFLIISVFLVASCNAQTSQYIEKTFTKTIVNNPTWVLTNININLGDKTATAILAWFDKDSIDSKTRQSITDSSFPNTITIWYTETFDEVKITDAINEALIAKLKENGLQFEDSDVVGDIK